MKRTRHIQCILISICLLTVMLSCASTNVREDSQAVSVRSEEVGIKKANRFEELRALYYKNRERTEGKVLSVNEGECMNVFLESIDLLEESDYQNYPIVAAAFHAEAAKKAFFEGSSRFIEARNEFEKAVEIYEREGYYTTAALNAVSLAATCEALKDLEKAEYYYKETVRFASKIPKEDEQCTPRLAVYYMESLIAFYQRHGKVNEAQKIRNDIADLRQCDKDRRDEVLDGISETTF